jgi:DNA-binding NarL/FixJ family response regulator
MANSEEVTSKQIPVLIVDDHPVVREGLQAMLKLVKGLHMLPPCESGSQALAILQSGVKPSVILLDARMPELDGFETLQLFRARFPKICVILLVGIPLRHEIERAKEMGASGFLSKSISRQQLVQAIVDVAGGGTAFMDLTRTDQSGVAVLSPRQHEILECLARGLSREDMGIALQISPETVKTHVKSILIKLDAADRAEAVSRGYELGLLQA